MVYIVSIKKILCVTVLVLSWDVVQQSQSNTAHARSHGRQEERQVWSDHDYTVHAMLRTVEFAVRPSSSPRKGCPFLFTFCLSC